MVDCYGILLTIHITVLCGDFSKEIYTFKYRSIITLYS